MKHQSHLYLLMQQDDQNISNQKQTRQHFSNKKKLPYQDNTRLPSYSSKSNSKLTRTLNKKNHNQQLQDLLQTQTINYGNISNLSTDKKRLFPEISFLSKDCTQDHSNFEGFPQMMSKIHFERSRNRQLNHQLTQHKQKLIQKYLNQLMEEFRQLSDQNQRLRQVYKKQAGGGYRQKLQKNQSMKQQESQKYNESLIQYQTEAQTPRPSIKTGRKSIAGGSVTGSQQPITNKYNSMKPGGQNKLLFGLGNQNFSQTQKMQNMLRQTNKMQYCQSSININNGQSLVPSPKRHKRRQSQLTQRKDYPGKENIGNDFLMILDDGSQLSFDNQVTGRMSQPGKMPKQRYAKEIDDKQLLKDSGHWAKVTNNQDLNNFGQTIQRNSLKLSFNQIEDYPQPETAKNIFIQFLQTMLIEQNIAYTQMAQDITEATNEQQQHFIVPSYNNNFKPIERLEKQIMTKNLKLRQLQEVINVFKGQIQQIMGTDIKIIDQLMGQLLEVKGKYLQMQQKVNGITGIKRQLESKQKLKEQILASIKQKIQKRKKQAQQKQQSIQQIQENVQFFSIPQSIKTLFDLLNIKMNKNSKPIDYLNEVKQLPKSKQLFQIFDSKKRAACNIKLKQVIDVIRQGRKKFNEVIKIYEGRIIKLQQKLQKYKNDKCQMIQKR